MPRALAIAMALGQYRRYDNGWLTCCPAHDDRNPSLRIKDGSRGVLVHCFAGCPREAVIQKLRELGLLDTKRQHVGYYSASPLPVVEKEDDGRNKAWAQDIWRQVRPIANTPVETYLCSRKLAVPDTCDLGYHPALWHSDSRKKWPAMVALVRHGVTNKPLGIHRTWLAKDGGSKAPVEPNKMMLASVSGGAVQFAAAGKRLAVAEGIETALSVMQSSDWPTWAALSAGGIEALLLPPLPLAEEVMICADNDASGRGFRAAEKLAERCFAQGRKPRIAMPGETGTDFNDSLRR